MFLEHINRNIGDRLTVATRTREVYLFGEIDDSNGDITDLISLMTFLCSISHDPMKLYVNSQGGNPSDALALLDTVNRLSHKNDIHVIGHGEVMSAAAFLLALSPRGCRHLTPHTTVMLHQVTYETGQENVATQRSWAAYMDEWWNSMLVELENGILPKRKTKKAKSDMRKKIEATWVLNAENAVKAGIADSLWTRQWEEDHEQAEG